MRKELRTDSRGLTRLLRRAHELCAKHSDVATTSRIETWMDEAERRVRFWNEIVAEA
jgi:starvation-inducible DNA-binding protein